MLTPSDQAAVMLYPELRRLIFLRENRMWSFATIHHDGALDMVVGAMLWLPERWSDAIAIKDRADAKAYRCDPAGGEVWGREGDLAEVIDGLAELPAPHERTAPRLVKATAADLPLTQPGRATRAEW